jgi:hypothetical protein
LILQNLQKNADTEARRVILSIHHGNKILNHKHYEEAGKNVTGTSIQYFSRVANTAIGDWMIKNGIHNRTQFKGFLSRIFCKRDQATTSIK